MSELMISIVVNVVLGAVLLALLWWRRSPDGARIATPAQALEIFRMHFPEAAGEPTVAADGRAALIALAQGRGIGLLVRQGRRWNARVLVAAELASVELEAGDVICLRFRDFGWPRARVRIVDPTARAAWAGRLHALAARHSFAPDSDLRHA